MCCACWYARKIICVVDGCIFIATEYGKYFLYVEAVECMSSARSIWHVGVRVTLYCC